MPLMSKPIKGVHGGPLGAGPFQGARNVPPGGAGHAPRLGSAWGPSDGCWGSLEDEEEEPLTHCCLPSGCPRYTEDLISLADTCDAVKVVCNNEQCAEGEWMHGDCFAAWEAHVLAYLRSSGRARSWSEKQRQQNLWTKKGYDLAYKACGCKCGRGHMRCDLGYVTGSRSDEERRMRRVKRRDRLSSVGNCNAYSTNTSSAGRDVRSPIRVQRSSFSSTGSSSSPPSSTGTTPVTPPGLYMPSSAPPASSAASKRSNSTGGNFDFFDADHAAAGNIFRRRTDLGAFGGLPHRLRNAYQIRTEDEGPHGNDETRRTVLTALSAAHATSVRCVACASHLSVYDRYPLVDGTFFLSPIRYEGTEEIRAGSPAGGGPGGKGSYLYAVCMRCMGGAPPVALTCRACRTVWSGAALLIGSMYAYDVFAAAPCCAARLACRRCKQPLRDPAAAALEFFSDYSRAVKCGHCGTEDFHFVRPLEEAFYVHHRF